MSVIEDIYADLDADVTEEAFREAVIEKVEQMGGLADEATAAKLVAHDLSESGANTIAEINVTMSDVSFVGKVMSIGELRTFERDDTDGTEGHVLNIEVADETGRVRVALWDETATAGADELEPGQVLRIKGHPKDGYNGLEVSATRVESDQDAEIDVTVGDASTIESLSLGQSDVTLSGRVLAIEPVRTFNRDDGSTGRVSNLVLGDETGRVRVTLWDEQADSIETLTEGESAELIDGYVRDRDGTLEVHVGSRGAIKPIDEDITFVPDTTPIEALEIGQTVDIAGVVRSTDPKRTFERDDGSEGQVRNIRVQDQTGDIRVALWGENADTDLGPGDEVLLADIEIQDGWKESLEGSVGWQSTISLLDDGAVPSTGDETSASPTESHTETPTEPDATIDTTPEQTHGSTDGSLSTTTSEATTVSQGRETESEERGKYREFTGTVVQTGDPVMVDNGDTTLTVMTDADVRLGEEVTARGWMHDETLDAEDIL